MVKLYLLPNKEIKITGKYANHIYWMLLLEFLAGVLLGVVLF